MGKITDWIKRVLGMGTRGSVQSKLGVKIAVSDEMTNKIELWGKMYQNKAPWLDDKIKSLNLPAAIASEIARMATIEMKSGVTGSARAKYIDMVYQGVIRDIRRYTEYACAKGGLVFKPYLSNGKLTVDYVRANHFYPTEFDSSNSITGAVFVDQVRRGEKYYTRVEQHSLKDNTYTVINKAYCGLSPSDLGRDCALSEVDKWAGLAPEVTIEHIERPLFSYFKIPQANTIDDGSPLGVSVYARAVGLIRQADELHSDFLWEFKSGARALYVDEAAFQRDPKTGRVRLPDERLYRALNVGVDSEGFFQDWSPDFREQSYLNALDSLLMRIEDNCGLARGTFSSNVPEARTATELNILRQRTYATVTDTQKQLQIALTDLVGVLDIFCDLYSLAPAGNYDVSFEFDDSIVADRRAEFAEKQQLVASGLMKPEHFRMWYFGESEEEAIKNLPDVLGMPGGDGM